MDALLKNGAEIYAVAYFGAILVVALVEWMLPRRAASDLVRVRWLGNFGLTVLGSVLVRLLFPIAGVGWAIFCRERGLGLLNHVGWPAWIAFPLTIVLIDLSHYVQHYLLHRVPVLWRLHRTHHTDVEYDFSTGVRFHPFEMIFATLTLMGRCGGPWRTASGGSDLTGPDGGGGFRRACQRANARGDRPDASGRAS